MFTAECVLFLPLLIIDFLEAEKILGFQKELYTASHFCCFLIYSNLLYKERDCVSMDILSSIVKRQTQNITGSDWLKFSKRPFNNKDKFNVN